MARTSKEWPLNTNSTLLQMKGLCKIQVYTWDIDGDQRVKSSPLVPRVYFYLQKADTQCEFIDKTLRATK